MLTLTGVCTILTVSILFIVLGYLVINGATSIDWAFLTQLPKPTGEVGGGSSHGGIAREGAGSFGSFSFYGWTCQTCSVEAT